VENQRIKELLKPRWERPYSNTAKCPVCSLYIQDKMNDVFSTYRYCPGCGTEMDIENADERN
jgi:NADH pyrophosphatase NudC (nudix superfamily)